MSTEFKSTVTITLVEYNQLLDAKKILSEGRNYTFFKGLYGEHSAIKTISDSDLIVGIVKELERCVVETQRAKDEKQKYAYLLQELRNGTKKVSDIPSGLL